MSIEAVVSGGYCIGCGACAMISPDISMGMNEFGEITATLTAGSAHQATSKVCPFAGNDSETEIARSTFCASDMRLDADIGLYRDTFAAYAPGYRNLGSSGGVVTWLLNELLRRGLIDGAIHVAPVESIGVGDRLFDYCLSTTASEIERGATSFYYPVSMDRVLDIVRNRPGRYAITGVPCFQKALRLLRRQDAVLDERLVYQIGIVCGQMKSAHYVEYLCSLAGMANDERIDSASFRKKIPGNSANNYAFEASVQSTGVGETSDHSSKHRVIRILNKAVGTNWGMGYFKPLACDFCDDVVAETADIAVMDAWLPEYVKDSDGWSLVVVRSLELGLLVDESAMSGGLVKKSATAKDIVDSQRGGFNHRRLALPYRLWRGRSGWVPAKRLKPSPDLALVLKCDQLVRSTLRDRSRSVWIQARKSGGMAYFHRRMKHLERAYRLLARAKHFLKLGGG